MSGKDLMSNLLTHLHTITAVILYFHLYHKMINSTYLIRMVMDYKVYNQITNKSK